MKTRGNLKNDLCKSRFGESPRHQLNQEGLLFNYLGRRVGLVSPPCASVPDILSAAINEKERKKKSSISETCRKSGIDRVIYRGIESGNRKSIYKNNLVSIGSEPLFENRLIT